MTLPGDLRRQQRRARRRRLGDGGDGGERIVLDDDAVEGVLRLVAGQGDDGGDRLADEAHGLVRQRAPRRRGRGLAIGTLEDVEDRDRLHAGLDEIGAGEDGDDAGHRQRLSGIDGDDPRMGVGRAQEAEEGLRGQRHIVGELASAHQQPAILDPRHGPAAAETSDTRLNRHCAHSPGKIWE